MKIKLLGSALIGALGAVSATASATVIDFNQLHNNDTTSYTYVQGPYHEDGYTLNASLCQTSLGVPNAGCFVSTQGYKSFDKPGATVTTQYVDQTVTITRDSGANFLFSGIDFSEYFDNLTYPPFTTNVNFSFLFADGTTGTDVRTFSNAGAYVPTTFTFNLAALKSFSFTPVSGSGVQFDNIVVNDVAATVPEAATWTMMLIGFGLIGATARRRRHKMDSAFG